MSQFYGGIVSAAAAAGAVPVGGIIMWSGAIVDIPANWALCDGTGGTPDLQDKFIVGAGNTYSPTNTGGFVTTTVTSASNGAHTHGGATASKTCRRPSMRALLR